MNILRLNLVVLYLFIVKSECGLLDSVIGTVTNTTRALKADIHNAVAYGNDLVFGERNKEDGHNTPTQEPKTEGLFTGLYHKSVNAVNNFREGVRNIFVKNDSGHPHKGIITRVFDSVNKKLKSIQDHFTPVNETQKIFEKPIANAYGYDLDKDSKVVRDKVLNVLYRNNTNVLNKLNISEADIYNLFKDVKGTVGVDEQLVLPTNDLVTNGIADVDVKIDVRSLADAVQDKL